MTGDLALDRIDRTDDPLKLAEDRVAEAEAALDREDAKSETYFTVTPDLLRAEWNLAAARRALAALRAQLAAEADDVLPYREGDA